MQCTKHNYAHIHSEVENLWRKDKQKSMKPKLQEFQASVRAALYLVGEGLGGYRIT